MKNSSIKNILESLRCDLASIENVTYVTLSDKVLLDDKKINLQMTFISAHDIDQLIDRYISDLDDKTTNKDDTNNKK